MTFSITGLDHVQLAMPAGEEAAADRFYAGLLGLERLSKPPALEARGGRWYRGGDAVLHLGVEAGFRPAGKAHPGITVRGLDALATRLGQAGHPVRWSEEIPGVRRFHTDDPWGNRLEFIEAR